MQQNAAHCRTVAGAIFCLLIGYSLILPTIAQPPQKGIYIVSTEHGCQFYDDEKPVMFYRTTPKTTAKGTYSRADYCHPLFGFDGEVITQDFPADHLHHRGIFWAWHQIYIGEKSIGDMWECSDFNWDIRDTHILCPSGDSAALQATVYWKSPNWDNGCKAFAEETVTIQVHPIVDSARSIDFRIEILALEQGLKIGGADNAKGYGGFSARIILPNDIKMTGPNGPVAPKKTPVPAGNWLNFSGTFGRKQSDLAIFVHPDNPGHPTRRWILRNSKSMQNAVYPGRKPIAVSTTRPLVLRYRLVLHDNAELDKLFRQYVCETKAIKKDLKTR